MTTATVPTIKQPYLIPGDKEGLDPSHPVRWQRDGIAAWPTDLYGGHRPTYHFLDTPYDPYEHAALWGIEVRFSKRVDYYGESVRGTTMFQHWPGEKHGLTPIIRVSNQLSPAQTRATLTHELIHVERGPFPSYAVGWEERLVNVLSARRLLIQNGEEPEWLQHPNMTKEEGDQLAEQEGTVPSMIWALYNTFKWRTPEDDEKLLSRALVHTLRAAGR